MAHHRRPRVARFFAVKRGKAGVRAGMMLRPAFQSLRLVDAVTLLPLPWDRCLAAGNSVPGWALGLEGDKVAINAG